MPVTVGSLAHEDMMFLVVVLDAISYGASCMLIFRRKTIKKILKFFSSG